MANPLEILGRNISSHRERAGFRTQAAFGEAVGVKQATVSAWEAGRIDIPYSTLCRIAEKLNTSPASLADPSVPVTASLDSKRLEAIRAILSDDDALDAAFAAIEGVIRTGASGAANKKRKPSAG